MLSVQIDPDNTDGLEIVFKIRHPMLAVSASLNSRLLHGKEPCGLRVPRRFYESPKENLPVVPELVQLPVAPVSKRLGGLGRERLAYQGDSSGDWVRHVCRFTYS